VSALARGQPTCQFVDFRQIRVDLLLPLMYIVETTLRPARLALAYSPGASNRVLRRAFRLLGGRWGGRYDIILCLDPRAGLDSLNAGVLSAADPDFLLVIDPVLESFDWRGALEAADRQPFHVIRFKERMETGGFGWLFRSQPTPVDSGVPTNRVIDVEDRALTWRRAAYAGLIPPRSTVTRLRTREGDEWVIPANRGGFGIRSIASEARWGVFGDFDDARCAALFWSLRALGARPFWRRPGSLKARKPPPSLRRTPEILLLSPTVSDLDLQKTATRWSSSRTRVAVGPANPGPLLMETAEAHFASQAIPVAEHKGFLRLATPPPPNLRGQPLRRTLLGVAEFRVRSPDAYDPDGLILARNDRSKMLISEGSSAATRRRVTRLGIAEVLEMATPQLVQLPLPTYREAVAAPFLDVGYDVTPSDKGRFQQRTLALARGLVFLTWVVRQGESSNLLRLFFTYHLSGKAPSGYRRAVEYHELRAKLHELLRSRRGKLRRPLLDRAESWLKNWSESLLERGLLVAGYVLACNACSARAWYRADSVGQQFRCGRCGQGAALSPTVQLSFSLNEAFYQFILNHGEIVTLSLAHLREAAEDSFLYLPETSLDDGTRTREIDAAALLDGRLVLVEAKSNARLTVAESRAAVAGCQSLSNCCEDDSGGTRLSSEVSVPGDPMHSRPNLRLRTSASML
jgi:hypothetical protein